MLQPTSREISSISSPHESNSIDAVSRFTRALKFLFLSLMLLISLTGGAAFAQNGSATPTPSPNSEEVKKLQERIDILEKEKRIAELEKETAVAERERLGAILPKPTATPLTGKTTVDDKVILESQILAYKALSEVSDNISGSIKLASPRPAVVIIHNATDVTALQSYVTIKRQVDATVARYRALLPAGSAEAGPASLLLGPEVATGLVRSAADLVALFRTDTEIKGLTFSVDEAALVSRISKGLQNSGIPVFYPGVYPLRVAAGDSSELLTSLSEVYVGKSKAEMIISRCDSSDKAVKEQCLNSFGDVLPLLKALNAQVEKFLTGLIAVDDSTKTNVLTSLIRAEGLRRMLEAENSCVLQLKVLAAAGSNKTTNNLFTGSKLYHSGGVVISYILFDRNGAIRLSDTLYNYDGFVRVKTKGGNLINNLGR
jgi:hypothetical protein